MIMSKVINNLDIEICVMMLLAWNSMSLSLQALQAMLNVVYNIGATLRFMVAKDKDYILLITKPNVNASNVQNKYH